MIIKAYKKVEYKINLLSHVKIMKLIDHIFMSIRQLPEIRLQFVWGLATIWNAMTVLV